MALNGSDRTLQLVIKANTSSAEKSIKTIANDLLGVSKGGSNAAASIKSLSNTMKAMVGVSVASLTFKPLKDSVEATKKSINSTIKSFGKVKQAKNALVEAANALKSFSNATGTMANGVFTPDARFAGLPLYEQELDNLKSTLEKSSVKLEKRWEILWSRLGQTAKAALGTIVQSIKTILGIGALVGTALFASFLSLTNSVTKLGDKIKESAQKLNLSYTKYQEWEYVLGQAGVKMSALTTGMRTFSNLVASNDNKLKAYGVTADNVSDAFEQAVLNIQSLQTENEKIAATTALFGKRASELLPIMKMDSKETANLLKAYRALGATMSDELVEASDKYRDSLTTLKVAFQGLKNSLATYFIPLFTSLVEKLTVAIAKLNAFFKSVFHIKESFNGVSTSAKGANTAASKLRNTLASFDELEVLDGDSIASEDALGFSGLANTLSDLNMKFNLSDIQVDAEGWTPNLLYDKLMLALPVAAGIFTLMKTGNIFTALVTAGVLLSIMEMAIDQNGKISIESIKESFITLIKTVAKGGLAGALIGFLVGGPAGALLGFKIGVALSLLITSVGTALSNAAQKQFEEEKAKYGVGANIVLGGDGIIRNTDITKPENGLLYKLKKVLGFANGGVLTTPTFGLMAEYSGASVNPEIVTPQNILRETIDASNGELANVFVQVGRQIVTAIENQDLSVNIDDQAVAKSAARGNSSYKRMTGLSLF